MFRLVLAGILFVTFLGCGEKQVPLFTMNFEEEFTIPAGLNTLETHTFVIQDIQTSFASYKNTFNVLDADIENVLPSRGKLDQIFSNLDYDFIERISIWAVSNVDPSYRYELYYLDFVQLNQGNELLMLSSISNIKTLMEEGSFDLEVKLNFRIFPPNQTDNIITFSFVANSI